MSTKIRISKKLATEIPAEVYAAIVAAADHTNIKSFSYEQKPTHKIYAGEGERYTVIYMGQAMSVEMVAEHNLGAANVRHEIGSVVNVPAGTVVIRVGYYGRYYMDVVNVTGDREIAMADMGTMKAIETVALLPAAA